MVFLLHLIKESLKGIVIIRVQRKRSVKYCVLHHCKECFMSLNNTLKREALEFSCIPGNWVIL